MRQKLEIGFFTDTYTPQINGVTTSIQIFQQELEKLGHNVYIFAPTPKLKDDSINIFRIVSIPFIFQPEFRLATPYSWHIDQRIKQLKLDIIHAHTPFSLGFFGKYVAENKNIPFIQTFHTLYPEYLHYILGPMGKNQLAKFGAKKLVRFLYNRSDLVIAPSKKIKDYLTSCGIEKPIEVISTGIDLDKFHNINNKIFRQKYSLDLEDKFLIYIGRLGKEKNLEFLLQVIKLIKDKRVKLLIIGDGPEKENLIKKAKQLKIAQRVIFLGYLPRKIIPYALQSSDIFVFTSKTETQGLVLLEAEASKKPIIALNDAVIEEFVQNNYNGFITEPDIHQFAQKIDYLLNNPKIYQKFANNSYKIAQRYSASKQAKKLVKVYKKLVTQP